MELFKIVSTNSILAVDYRGRVKRLYCPFRVVCKEDVVSLKKGERYAVDAVKMTLELKEVFIIKGRAYYIWYFTIIG